VNAVGLVQGQAGLSPSGMNGEVPFTNFEVMVQDLAYDKIVGIWGHDINTGNWSFNPCTFGRKVPGNFEIWTGGWDEGVPPDQFDIEYQVSGNVYWDNNAGYNYSLSPEAAQGADGVQTVVIGPNVLVGGYQANAGNLDVQVLVKNIAIQKQVAIVYTTDNWFTYQNAFGIYSRPFAPASTPHQLNTELWSITAPVPAGSKGQFAAFYNVDGVTYWDSNFGVNYSF
jgi:Carbohydrate/starch-binding module (family 21)